MSVTVHHGDCLDVMRTLPDASVDAIVTDPPYGLGFMGREWDSLPPGLPWARECLRVLRPGGYLLAFGGTRTWHRLACAVEDAGFEIRDSIAWMYGSGFPKSLDVSKAIDKARHEDRGPMLTVRSWLNEQRLRAGLTLGQVNAHFGLAVNGGGNASNWMTHPTNIEIPSWEKWLSLKSLMSLPDDMDAEVWRLNGRKGSPGDTWQSAEVVGVREDAMAGWSMDGATQYVDREDKAPATDAARQWQGWGTALKPAFEPIVVARKPLVGTVAANVLAHGTGALNVDGCRVGTPGRSPSASGWTAPAGGDFLGVGESIYEPNPAGRWPANVVLDESQAEALDEQSGTLQSGAWTGKRNKPKFGDQYGDFAGREDAETPREADEGGASRFFYVAKADASERVRVNGTAHPTVKPLTLMRWLVRLVTPPGGTVLEPFAGSGTTVEACILEGFSCIAIEREADYLPLIQQRIDRRRDPVAAVKATQDDGGLFDLLEGESA